MLAGGLRLQLSRSARREFGSSMTRGRALAEFPLALGALFFGVFVASGEQKRYVYKLSCLATTSIGAHASTMRIEATYTATPEERMKTGMPCQVKYTARWAVVSASATVALRLRTSSPMRSP